MKFNRTMEECITLKRRRRDVNRLIAQQEREIKENQEFLDDLKKLETGIGDRCRLWQRKSDILTGCEMMIDALNGNGKIAENNDKPTG